MRILKIIIFSSLLITVNSGYANNRDSLNTKRLKTNLALDAVLMTGSYLALNQLWYKDYDKRKLHWFNDGNEWLQMDKLGHAFSTYHVSSIYYSQVRYCGLSNKKSSILGAGLGFTTISLIELLDASSTKWGASGYDLLANGLGAGLFMSQELLWQEQKIKMKFSYSKSGYPFYRPDALGKSFSEQLMKDYNAQTYWLSANVRSLSNLDFWPKWLNLAVGYSANGMLGGMENPRNLKYLNFDRERQFLLSFDIDLSKINVRQKWLKQVFRVINIVKIPAPTLEFRSGKLYGHYLYF
jgi:hypothetical protein